MDNAPVVDIFHSDSPGLHVDAGVLASAIRLTCGSTIHVRRYAIPARSYEPAGRADFRQLTGDERPGRVAIFLEKLPAGPFLADYARRVLVPNPEWIRPTQVEQIRSHIDLILHKSRYSHAMLLPHFPDHRHDLIGFTSPDPRVRVQEGSSFAHFRGKSPMRHTQQILDIWQRRPDLPPLYIQAYGSGLTFQVDRWLSQGNIHLALRYYPRREEYFAELARSGVHLCTSQVEGFGHYINESRALGALILALDAPPMNELVTAETGILIPVKSRARLNMGIMFVAEPAAIEDAVDRAVAMGDTERRRLGAAARQAFEQDSLAFRARLKACIETCLL